MIPARQGRISSRRLALLGLCLGAGCQGDVSREEPAAASSVFISEAGWILPSAADPEPSAADQHLYDQSYTQALLSFHAQAPSPRRALGLGQAHLGLGRFEADLFPLVLRLVRDLLERRLREQALEPEEKALLDWCRATRLDAAQSVSESLASLLELEVPALLELAEDRGPLFGPEPAGPREALPHPADAVAGARLHLRAARALLASVQAADVRAPAEALAAQAQRLLDPLEAGQAPVPGAGAGPGRTCLAEGFRLAAMGRSAEALERLQSCNPSQEAESLAAADPSWLILRALLRYQEGSCSSYALAALDLSVLEKSFPAVRGAVAGFRQLYARECSAGGRLAGG
jgi:hypothetical protein